jgi:ribosomal protein L19
MFSAEHQRNQDLGREEKVRRAKLYYLRDRVNALKK